MKTALLHFRQNIVHFKRCILLGILAISFSVHAKSDDFVVRKKVQKPSGDLKSWSMPLTLERSSTLHEAGSYERSSFTALALSPSYKINKFWTLNSSTMIYKEENSVGNSGWDNTSVGLNRSFKHNDRFQNTLGAGVVLPTDYNLRKDTSFQGAARLAGSVRASDLFLKSSISYVLQFTRNFHEFEQTAAGGFNVKQTVTNSISYIQPLNDSISLSSSLTYSYGWTYLDDSRTKFAVGADLNWQATPSFSVYVGTSNEGNALKPNGSDSNIEFYNDDSSILKVGLNYVI